MAKKKSAKKKPAKLPPDCKCLEQINKELERIGENTRLDSGMWMDWEAGDARCRPVLAVYKADKKNRKQTVGIAMIFCPFCGKKYPRRKTPTTKP